MISGLKSKGLSPERISWEFGRAFHSFKKSPVLAVLLFELAAFIVVHAKGAGAIYGDMIGILLLITLAAWFGNSVLYGNKMILICSLVLLTVGTMLQCIMKQEYLLKNPDLLQKGNPAAGLQLQYLLGFAAAVAAAFFYRKWKGIAGMRACRIMIVLSLAISVVTLLLAKSVGNVKNWVSIGGISLQTTELVKPLYIFIASALLGTQEKPSKDRIHVFYGVTLIEILFLALQSEFGTMLLLLLVFLTYVFLFIPDLKVFLRTAGVMAAAVLLLVMVGTQLNQMAAAGSILGVNPLSRMFLSNYNKIANRFIYWLHPEKDALGLGYQLLKAKESILLGGWFGTSSVTDLPVKTSDLVYPALVQRCGMVFAILVFFVFILLWLEGVRTIVRKQDRYHSAVAAGLVFMLFDQALIIIGGSTGLCPLTGITLPFISSGGSSLVISFMLVGLLLAVSGNVSWKGLRKDEEDEFFKEGTVAARCYAGVCHLNDHIPHPDFRSIAGRLRRGGQAENEGEGENVSEGIHKGKYHRQRGKHSGGFRGTGGKKNVQ